MVCNRGYRCILIVKCNVLYMEVVDSGVFGDCCDGCVVFDLCGNVGFWKVENCVFMRSDSISFYSLCF